MHYFATVLLKNGLRAYGTQPQIWLENGKDCGNHQWETVHKKPTGGKNPADRPANVGSNRSQNDMDIRGEGTYSDFCPNCNAWKGELGLEPTFQLYIEHLLMIFDEIKRVLKKTGTCFVNLGDSYSTISGNATGKNFKPEPNKAKGHAISAGEGGSVKQKQKGIQSKSLLQIPSRFSIGMTDRGWILRNKLIWYKRNCMPSSAKDRFTVDFEEIFFFTKSQKYFFEQQFEPSKDPQDDVRRLKKAENYSKDRQGGNSAFVQINRDEEEIAARMSLGRNKRCVWDIPPKPFSEAHFAVYPPDLVEPMIKAGSPEEICNKCGKAREKIYEKKYKKHDKWFGNKQDARNGRGEIGNGYNELVELTEVGLSDCGCNAGFHPGVVIDPFGGSGTTGIVAKKLNRDFILLELQEKYIEIAERRFHKEFGLFHQELKAV